MDRIVRFSQAKKLYVNRYTMEHVPAWAKAPVNHPERGTVYYAPQYRTDKEWYENSVFPGEAIDGLVVQKNETHCMTRNATWPLGKWLDKPYVIPL